MKRSEHLIYHNVQFSSLQRTKYAFQDHFCGNALVDAIASRIAPDAYGQARTY